MATYIGTPCINGHDGLRYKNSSKCVACLKKWHADYYQKNKVKKTAQMKAWASANSEKVKVWFRHRNYAVRGLPAPTRERPDICECCDRPPTAGRVLCLDHCHETGKFRGWLCTRCNRGIGMLRDNAKGVQDALAYLGRAP